MKKLFFTLLLATSLVSCEQVFLTDPNNIINTEDYISVDDEMYKGYLGIMAKMQKAGDHAILLTDTRGDFLEVTKNAPLDLQSIYQYDPTNGNPYANPTCYYAVVVACNDYIQKMKDYRARMGESMDNTNAENFKKLISSTLRVKVWAYLSIGRIYGKAVWFDDPLNNLKQLNDTAVFENCDMNGIVGHCLNLLDNGISLYKDSVISAKLEMDWGAWINEENPTNNYDHWNYIIPPWLLLRCDLLSWRGTTEDYQWIRDNILSYLYKVHQDGTVENAGWYYACNIPLMTGGDNKYNCEYYKMFFTEQYNTSTKTNLYQAISGIMYDYENHQSNRLVEYFCPTSSGQYYLRPSSYAVGKYVESDTRGIVQRMNMDVIGSDTCFTKYYYHLGKYLRDNIVEIQPVIPIYRGHDYHFLLSEAENHLGNYWQSEVILNDGVTNQFADKILPKSWNTNYNSWFCPNGGYGDVGIVGCVRGKFHSLPSPKDASYNLSEAQRKKAYDLALVDEALLEYAGEGKSYAMMVRMAEKYHDPAIVADRVCPKYPESMRDRVRASIMSGGYWVDWDLKTNELTTE